MKFYVSIAVASLAAVVCAKPSFTNSGFTGIEEGVPFELTWSGAVGPVTITVVTGDSKNLQPVQVITSTGAGGKYEWTPQGLPSGQYALKIQDTSDPDPNFSAMFSYTGTGTLTTSGASSTPTSSSTPTMTTTSSAISSDPVTTTTSKSTTSKTSSTTTSSNTSKPTNTNDSPKYKSPLALILVTVAALAYFS